MNQKVEASRQALRDDGISHQDITVEMVHSLSQEASNASDRLPPIELPQQLDNQQTAASEQGDKRRARESLRARRLKASIIKEQIDQKEQEREYISCQVCTEDCSIKAIKVFGDCGHKYCPTCLNQHIENSIKQFKTVRCPHQYCPQSLDITSPHIRELKLPLQQKYYKIRVFLNLSKQQDIRMCPTENCEGFINKSEEKMQCPICGISFCRQCQLPRHSGNCDQSGAKFFEDNYKFRRCDRCRMVLERNKGCDHMTCKCGYQFCYLCGVKWVSNHKCKPKAPAPASDRPASDPAIAEGPVSPQAPLSAPVPVSPPIPVQAQAPAPAPAPLPAILGSLPIQPLPRPQVIQIQLPLPHNQPISSQMISVAINNQQIATNLQQNHQASNHAIAIDSSNLNPPHQTVPANQNCLISCLKTILIALVVLPVHLLSLQFCFPIFFFIIVPILISIFYFFYSLVIGMQKMIQNQSWLKIALLNVFLYIYYVLDCYCRKWDAYFRQEYCIRKYLSLQSLFPISQLIIRRMKQCLA